MKQTARQEITLLAPKCGWEAQVATPTLTQLYFKGEREVKVTFANNGQLMAAYTKDEHGHRSFLSAAKRANVVAFLLQGVEDEVPSTTPRERSYAEQQADRALDLLLRWVNRIMAGGGVYQADHAEIYEFARVVFQVYFHAEREQMPLDLVMRSRADLPSTHAAWEAFTNAAWVTNEIVGMRPDNTHDAYLRSWLDEALTVYSRRTMYYIAPSV